MHIAHIAIWVNNLEKMRSFYTTYFDAISNEKYVNPRKKFSSYFLSFGRGGCQLEIMHRPDIAQVIEQVQLGLAHLAISVGSKAKVDQLTQQLQNDGYQVIGAPRTTGDGYYESVVLDPEGNHVEITV
ncbi:VOC family protein [Microscilla marina]|uniref:Glyoxalase family protein n=1 Tax=Microscilla marina ATCC 23134 TaxID=313606 RepID=A1ZP46_MICM2|nr:VOC family protein [Microscilla marina]EAY27838.1 glyoxalase family protein [Microscilla marina ATCC 23134]